MSFAILGAYNMFDNKLNQYRTKVCPEIEKIKIGLGPRFVQKKEK